MKLKLLTLAAAVALPALVSANPAFKKTDDAIAYRQQTFQLMRIQIGNMGDMLKGKVEFNAETFQMRANNAAALSKMPWEAFYAGTDKGDTSALPAVWTDNDTFMQKANAFADYADKLAVAAQSGDLKKIKPAFGAWAKGCKDCHKSFKD
jgi:cytochrome c556